MKWICKFFLLVFLLPLGVLGEETNESEMGRLPVVNFHHRQYNGHSQSWGITQDKNGLIYIANNVGIIQYDGQEWRHISINKALSRCVNADKYGNVWVGAQDELGFLAPDSTNSLSFNSLLSLVPEQYKPFGLVRQVYPTAEGVYFSTFDVLLRYNPNKTFSAWTPKTKFHRAYYVDDMLFVTQNNLGIFFLKGDSLVSIPQSEQLFDSSSVYVMLPLNEKYILVGTQSDGFYLLDKRALTDSNFKGNPFIRFKTSNDAFFVKNRIYSAEVIDNSTFAVGTYSGGVALVDVSGHVIRYINTLNGLQDNSVWFLFKDNQNNLWMALNNGVSFSPIYSPLTFWGENEGVDGVVQSVLRHNGVLYYSSNIGVFNKLNSSFVQVKGVSDLSWGMKEVHANGQKVLLVASSGGIFSIEKGNAKLVENGKLHSFNFCESKFYPNIIYVGIQNGIGIVSTVSGKLKYVGKMLDTQGDVYRIVEDSNGDIWYSCRYNGVGYIDMVNPYQQVFEKPVLFKLPYDPKCDEMGLNIIDGNILASTERGLSKYVSELNCFEPDSSLGLEFANGSMGLRIFNQDMFGNIWFEAYKYAANRWVERAKHVGGKKYRRVAAQYRSIPETIFFDTFTEPDSVTWIASTDGLFRYNDRVFMGGKPIFKVLIRKVTTKRREVIFNGEYYQEHQYLKVVKSQLNSTSTVCLPYSSNSLNFEFASPYFEVYQSLKYSYMLEGYDEDWSNWKDITFKEYTNLPYGHYRFLVKAKNLLGEESPVTEFDFDIDKPIFFKWYAVVFYTLLLTIIFWGVVKINTRLLRVSNIKLQGLVDERTKELQQSEQMLLEKNVELQHQKEEILAQRDELEIRNRHINDSIQYAKTIQQAILPDLSTAFGDLFEYFLIYMPKDLVSGDFYWVSHAGPKGKPNDKLFIAVVDCTGHGVPGAFMSLIGSRLLSEIVNERRIHNPAAILTELSQSVNQALRQDVSESFDGMDIALLMLERKSDDLYVLTFAGANRPLYYYVKGDDRIQTLKGNRKSIGSVLPDVDTEFTNWRVTLRVGDMLFLTTDGFTDQNSTFRRKFTACRLHTHLLADVDKPMNKIAEHLTKEFFDFKGEEPQRDDVTLLGIRLK
ncbi:MAG TPA: SpoIIE family protein phosphatase [Tenuifilaceae bacterium]|nr:SpoIIE family protein phosphatase [Tenuifilaceae bacterium]